MARKLVFGLGHSIIRILGLGFGILFFILIFSSSLYISKTWSSKLVSNLESPAKPVKSVLNVTKKSNTWSSKYNAINLESVAKSLPDSSQK